MSGARKAPSPGARLCAPWSNVRDPKRHSEYGEAVQALYSVASTRFPLNRAPRGPDYGEPLEGLSWAQDRAACTAGGGHWTGR